MEAARFTAEGRRHALSTVISRIVAQHLHAELDRGVGDQPADRAQADHAQRAARQLDSRRTASCPPRRACSKSSRRRRAPARRPRAGTRLRAASEHARRTRAPSPRSRWRPGALNTGTPRWLISSTGMLFTPAPARPIAFTLRRDLRRPAARASAAGSRRARRAPCRPRSARAAKRSSPRARDRVVDGDAVLERHAVACESCFVARNSSMNATSASTPSIGIAL